MKIRVNDKMWPIVIVTLSTKFDEDEWRAHLDEVNKLIERGEPLVIVNDNRGAQMPSSAQRHSAVENMRRMGDKTKNVLGIAMIIDSAIMRGGVTALSWLMDTPYKLKTFGDIPPALAWAKKLLAAREQLRSAQSQM